MTTRFAATFATLVALTATSYADPTPPPKQRKAKVAAPKQERAVAPAATGVFVLQLRANGTVEKVLIARSTGNKTIDAWTTMGLSQMRFRPEELTKEELAKRQKILTITLTEQELKNARYLPQPRS